MYSGENKIFNFSMLAYSLVEYYFLQFKMKSQLHYGEEDWPISATDGFLKEEELHYEIELIDFFKAKARM